MCLEVGRYATRQLARNAKKEAMKIAKTDIEVYKILNVQQISPFYNLKYEKGWHYYQEGDRPFTYSIYKGVHGAWELNVEQGLHSCCNLESARKLGNCMLGFKIIVPMIIPKGAKYYIDRNMNEYVSDQLIYI